MNSIWSIHSLWNVHVNLRQVIVMSVSQSTDYVKCIYYDLDIRSLGPGELFNYFVLRKQDCQALNIISPIMNQMC